MSGSNRDIGVVIAALCDGDVRFCRDRILLAVLWLAITLFFNRISRPAHPHPAHVLAAIINQQVCSY
jgi:hypothetical protein